MFSFSAHLVWFVRCTFGLLLLIVYFYKLLLNKPLSSAFIL